LPLCETDENKKARIKELLSVYKYLL